MTELDLTEVGHPFLHLISGNTALEVIRISGRRRIALVYQAESDINGEWVPLAYFLNDDAVKAILEFFGGKSHDE